MAEPEIELANSPDSQSVEVPVVEMVFNTEDEIRTYYREYAYKVGFGVTKRSSRKKNGIQYFTLACSRYGTYVSSSSNPRPTIASNCQAKVNVKVNAEKQYEISKVVLAHNHDLSPNKSRHFRCNKKMDLHARRSLEIHDAAGVRMNKNFSSLVHEAGGHEHMSFGESETRTYVRKTRLQLGSGDADALQQYFCRMQQKNSSFYYVMDINDEGRLMNVFWADARCRAAYHSFSDAITFDSTYLTNKYDMPFAPFVGVNHHGQSILLGCALLSSEDTSTYIWLFRCWLECMSGVAPGGIVTDQCAAMKEAISIVFSSTHHRLCLWHIMRKIPVKLSRHDKYPALKKTLKNVVYETVREEEFEQTWKAMIEEFDLHTDSWLANLYELRASWVPVYLRKHFWAEMSTTQRSESMNAFFDGYVNSKTSLKQFVKKYDNALRKKAEKVNQADFNSFSKTLPLVSDLSIEKQFATIYTHDILKKFQTELKGLCYCNVREVNKGSWVLFTFEVTDSMLARNQVSRKHRLFQVNLNLVSNIIECECNLFAFQGIICRHIVAAMNFRRVDVIPDNYILHRWRKDIRRHHTLIPPSYDDSTSTPQMQRYDELTRLTRGPNELASCSVEKFNWWKNYSDLFQFTKGSEDNGKMEEYAASPPHRTSSKFILGPNTAGRRRIEVNENPEVLTHSRIYRSRRR